MMCVDYPVMKCNKSKVENNDEELLAEDNI